MADNNVVQGVVANAMPQEWISGLCGCFSSCGICFQTIMCELCTLTNIATKLHSNAGVCDCGTCCSICCCGTSCFIPCSARREVIQRFGIRGEGTCGSCVKATICCQCSLCQVQNEMAQRGEHCGGCCASGPPPQQQMMGAPGSPIQGGSMMAPKPWSTGLCACSGMECCEGFLCPCFVAGYMSAKFFDVLEGTNDPTNPRCDCCTSLCSLLPNTACCFYFMLRREAIARYRIWGESHCNTLCMLYWCFPCAIMQARREMGMHREWPGGCCVKEAPASVTDNLSNKPPA